jgi:hypothetical protein
MFSQIRRRNSEIRTKTELFLDNWAFHHGGITKSNFKEAVRAWVKYATRIIEQMNRKRDEAEFRNVQGALGEFADLDDSLADLPGDGVFEKALIKHDPTLKRYRK